MILNLYRTISELSNYLKKARYPRAWIITYSFVSIALGILLSNSDRVADLPALTVVAILFGFTINAVVMLGNSSEHYLSNNNNHSDQLKKYYQKSLHISIHTLGIGLVTIMVTGFFQLFPYVNIPLTQIQILEYTINVEILSALVYTLIVYYLIIFAIVIASTAELVKIRI